MKRMEIAVIHKMSLAGLACIVLAAVLSCFMVGCSANSPNPLATTQPSGIILRVDQLAGAGRELASNPTAQEVSTTFPFGPMILSGIGLAGLIWQTIRKNQSDKTASQSTAALSAVVNHPSITGTVESLTNPNTVNNPMVQNALTIRDAMA